jgi:asparagine synthase (glutamine-hydrolysing)
VEDGPLAAVGVGDVELTDLLKGYAEQGPDALLSGAGRYAVAVIDTAQRTLTLARTVDGPALWYAALDTAVDAGNISVHAASVPIELDVPVTPVNDAMRQFVETGEIQDSLLLGIGLVAPGQVVELSAGQGIRDARISGGSAEPSRPAPAADAASAAELTEVAALADALTRDLWRFLRDVGLPAASPAEYLRWAATHSDSERVPPQVPTWQLLLRLKNRIYGSFLSDSFGYRGWQHSATEVARFEEFIRTNGTSGDADRFWRVYLAEQWGRIVASGVPEPVKIPEKGLFAPNQDKQLEITVDGERWRRVPIRTELFAKGDDLAAQITDYLSDVVTAATEEGRDIFTGPWYLVVSEKIVAIAQGRSYFVWEIEPSWWARTLSKYVVRTPFGIGLGSPWTMELALREVGLPRILLASAVSLVGKAIGRRGWFYRVAGPAVRAIDGPTEYSAYPANVSAKLAPARPNEVSRELTEALRTGLSFPADETLRGVVVIDANDIGRNVMGQATDLPDRFFEEVFADNPLGQGDERTPLCVVAPVPVG